MFLWTTFVLVFKIFKFFFNQNKKQQYIDTGFLAEIIFRSSIYEKVPN